jgi:hypothetical protein
MRTFLDRYTAGEWIEVWNDLTALGDGVRHPLYAKDAAAVATETMRRARQNVETLIRRIDTMGYRFLDEVSSAEDELVRLEKINQMAEMMKNRVAVAGEGPNPHVQSLLAGGLALNEKTDAMRALRKTKAAEAAAKKRKDPLKDKHVFYPPDKATAKQIARLEKLAGGPMPMSLRAWYEGVGGVSLMGSHPLLNPKQANENDLPDPLVMISLEEMLAMIDGEGEGDGVQIMVAPDALHKADISGDGYYLRLPDRGADFVFDDGSGVTFVNYLRRVFAWGGFPGWEQAKNPPRDLIAQLSNGLAPV